MATKVELQARIDDLEAKRGATAALVDALPPRAERTPWVAAQAEVALALARQLDDIGNTSPSAWKGPPPNVSAIAKELRSALDALECELSGDSDPAGFFDIDVPADVGDASTA